jgi:hypothetical protein
MLRDFRERLRNLGRELNGLGMEVVEDRQGGDGAY